jgi:hypothetical protein
VVSLIKQLFYPVKKQKETFIQQKQKNKTKKRTKKIDFVFGSVYNDGIRK